MAELPIMLCNYKFAVDWKTPKGQKRREIHECKMAPLIGSDDAQIIEDPTGYNENTIRRIYMRTSGTKSHIKGCQFTIIEIEVVKQRGSTTWIDKKV